MALFFANIDGAFSSGALPIEPPCDSYEPGGVSTGRWIRYWQGALLRFKRLVAGG
jgi:hypothetical protein